MSLLGMKGVGHLKRSRGAPQRTGTCLHFHGRVESPWIDQRARVLQAEGKALSKRSRWETSSCTGETGDSYNCSLEKSGRCLCTRLGLYPGEMLSV